MAGGELVDAAEDRLRVGDILVGQVGVDGLGADFPRHPRRLQQGLQFAGEQQPARLGAIDQRLFAQAVAGQQELLLPGVPQGQGEHAVEGV